jgi:hypothetical protein
MYKSQISLFRSASEINITRMRGWVCIILLFALAVCLMYYPTAYMFERYSRNFNEGWNAYQISRYEQSVNIYFPVTDINRNVYTPFSFMFISYLHIIAPIDIVVLGRIVSLLSLLWLAVCCFYMVRRNSDSLPAAVFAGLLFICNILSFYYEYVATNDPHLLAMAFVCSGFTVFATGAPTPRRLAATVLLMAVGLYSKQTLIAGPAAISLWLLCYHRRALLIWLSMWTMIGVTVALWSYRMFGTEFFTNVLVSEYRIMDLHLLLRGLFLFFLPLFPLVVLSAWYFMRAKGASTRLLIFYAVLAASNGAFLVAHQGISGNHVFELVFCLSLGWALLVGKADTLIPSVDIEKRTLQSVLMLPAVMVVASALPSAVRSGHVTVFENRYSAQTIELLAKTAGPVLCETLVLCYWAGKPLAMDLSVGGMRIKTNPEVESQFVRLMTEKNYALVQLEGLGDTVASTPRLSDRANQALANAYVVMQLGEAVGVLLSPRPASF